MRITSNLGITHFKHFTFVLGKPVRNNVVTLSDLRTTELKERKLLSSETATKSCFKHLKLST